MIRHIYIIYNPHSTGDGKANAKQLRNDISAADSDIQVRLLPTSHAGHAINIARDHAAPDTMIVSSSGDGGFHEVVNGVLTSDYPGTIVGLLPSGNANDHYHSQHTGDIVDRIKRSDVRTAPVLRLSWADQTLYAHSYAGLGLTADIGHTLTKASLNPLREAWIVIKGLLIRRSVRLIIDGKTRRYDSLVYAVAERMSKYLQTGASQAAPDEFAVIATPHRSLTWLLRHLLHRTQEPSDPTIATSASFTTIRHTRLQCDGEVTTIPAHTTVTITAKPILNEII